MKYSLWVGLVFRLVLAGILGFAGLTKIFQGDGARLAVVAYRILPHNLDTIVGYGLPALEILLSLLLLIGLFTRWAALATALLMVVFIGGIISVWVRGYSIDCGCFGGGGDVSPEGLAQRYLSEIGRDIVFAAMAIWLIIKPKTKFSLDPSEAPTEFTDEDSPQDETQALA